MEIPKEITAKAFQIYLETGILNVNKKGKIIDFFIKQINEIQKPI